MPRCIAVRVLSDGGCRDGVEAADFKKPGAVYVALLSRSGVARQAGGGERLVGGVGGKLLSAGAAPAYLGSAVAGVGDLDGNGVPDMVVGLHSVISLSRSA